MSFTGNTIRKQPRTAFSMVPAPGEASWGFLPAAAHDRVSVTLAGPAICPRSLQGSRLLESNCGGMWLTKRGERSWTRWAFWEGVPPGLYFQRPSMCCFVQTTPSVRGRTGMRHRPSGLHSSDPEFLILKEISDVIKHVQWRRIIFFFFCKNDLLSLKDFRRSYI